MGIYTRPNTVTNGLVLCLDAANFKSYPRTGTAWTNLANTNLTGSLGNNPTFNTTVGGNFKLNGSNNFIDFFAPNLGTTTTVEMWANIVYGENTALFYWGGYGLFFSGGWFGFNTSNSDIYGLSSGAVTGDWKHCIFEMRSDVSYSNNKIYVNGVLQSIAQRLNTESAANRNFNNGNGRIGAAGGSFFNASSHAIFRVYNRALTLQEIIQNYNAMKTRFRLS